MLQDVLLDLGAELDDDDVALSFGNDDEALDAALNGVAVRWLTVLTALLTLSSSYNDNGDDSQQRRNAVLGIVFPWLLR